MVADTVSVGAAIYNDGRIGVETGRSVTGIAGGGWAGATSGATLVATLGSAVPIVGTVVGAAMGGVVGGLGGAVIGEQLAKGAFKTIKS